MIKKALLETVYDAASMQRWNDKVRPVDLRELDKQAHKMVIAYVIGKIEEDEGKVDWCGIIEGGIFEFLQRMVLTDLKPQVFGEIKKDKDKYRQLNEHVYKELDNIIRPLGEDFCTRFRKYFRDSEESKSKKIVRAAHFFATRWEFEIIERANPGGYEIPQIKREIRKEIEKYYDLAGVKQLVLSSGLSHFVDLCGQLRFQLRWSHTNMAPRTSVLGHMLIVAMLAYLFSMEVGACKKRLFNNYFTGLFHDLPEVLTRDIISPVKRSIRGLSSMIKSYEKKQMDNEVYPLLPKSWHPQVKIFTEDEFSNIVMIENRKQRKLGEEIQKKYNYDKYSPRNGDLIKAIDDLAAYLEVYLSRKNGIENEKLRDAENRLRLKYKKEGTNIAGVDFAAIYADFKI